MQGTGQPPRKRRRWVACCRARIAAGAICTTMHVAHGVATAVFRRLQKKKKKKAAGAAAAASAGSSSEQPGSSSNNSSSTEKLTAAQKQDADKRCEMPSAVCLVIAGWHQPVLYQTVWPTNPLPCSTAALLRSTQKLASLLQGCLPHLYASSTCFTSAATAACAATIQLCARFPACSAPSCMHTYHLPFFPRFQKALDSAKQGEDMWVLLESANIHDAKLKKVRSIAACCTVHPVSTPVSACSWASAAAWCRSWVVQAASSTGCLGLLHLEALWMLVWLTRVCAYHVLSAAAAAVGVFAH